MESKRTATTYFIPPGKFLLMENALGNPDLIQSSVSSDCRVTIVDKENFPLDELEQWPTFRLTAADILLNLGANLYYIYIVVPMPDNTESTSAFIAYNTALVDRDGYEVLESTDEEGNVTTSKGELLGKEGFRYYQCGTVSARGTNSSATTVPPGQGRIIEMDLGVTPSPSTLPGDLNDFDKIFQIDKVDLSNPKSWLLTILSVVKEMTARIIRVTGSLIFGSGENEKPVTDVATSEDVGDENMIGDTILASTAWVSCQMENVDKKYLRKDKNDRSIGQIASDVGFEAGEFVPEATGAACYQDKDGNWHIETDHLRVRKKATFTEIEVQEVHHVGGQMLLTAANMIVDYVFEMEDRYRCYFLKKDSDGREVENLWQTGDQAYCNTFNLEKQSDGTLGNHYLWRRVVGTNLDTKDDAEIRTFGETTIQTADYNFADLSKEICAENSDAPKASDEIVQLGYQEDDDPGRQNAILIAGAGSGSPYIYEFTGINWFTLDGHIETQIKPGDNVFTGKMHIQPGSTGADSLTDLPDEIFKAAQIGGVNLLLNSGFTGNYKTEDLQRTSHTESDFDLYSRNFLYWEGNATLNENDTDAASTWSANIGLLEQKVTLIDNELYVVSFKAKGKQAKVYVGNTSKTVELTSEYQRYVLKYSFTHTIIGQHRFRIEGDATVCDLQLERGTIATDYKPSPLDNDKSFAEFQSLYYLSDALKHGSTTILNGLILSSVIQLGNYLEGEMQKVNAGMSGIYHDDNDVAFWGGGTFEQAIHTVMKFKQNPRFRPTDAEWQNMANFVVSHGGDIFMRGYIHALGGYFRGKVEIAGGKILLNEDGSGQLSNGIVSWTKEGVMYRRSPDILRWIQLAEFPDRYITYEKGTCFDVSIPLMLDDVFYLTEPEYDNFSIIISFRDMLSRRMMPARLHGNFSVYDNNTRSQITVSHVSLMTSSCISGAEVKLTYIEGTWIVPDAEAGVNEENDTAYLGVSNNLNVDIVKSKEYFVDNEQGKDETVSIKDSDGTHKLTFKQGILVDYKKE